MQDDTGDELDRDLRDEPVTDPEAIPPDEGDAGPAGAEPTTEAVPG